MSKSIDELKTAADFREFFAEIPDEKWTTGTFVDDATGCKCALGHLLYSSAGHPDPFRFTSQLRLVIDGSVASVNDGKDSRFPQPTPKARILAALDDAIAKGF